MTQLVVYNDAAGADLSDAYAELGQCGQSFFTTQSWLRARYLGCLRDTFGSGDTLACTRDAAPHMPGSVAAAARGVC